MTHAPFRVAVRVRGHETTVFNRRSLFEFEYKRDAPAEGESWSESFNSHTDSRPKRTPPRSRSTSPFPTPSTSTASPSARRPLSLKETKDANGQAVTEPYRMYNLDVFEYLAESPFGLYGSIPVMLAHAKVGGGAGGGVFGTARARALETVTSAVYFNNPTETYVDVSKSRVSGGFGGGEKIKSVDALWMAESGSMDVFVAPGPHAGGGDTAVHVPRGHHADAPVVRVGVPPVQVELQGREGRRRGGRGIRPTRHTVRRPCGWTSSTPTASGT